MKSVSILLLAAACLNAAVVFEPNRGQAGGSAAYLARTKHGLVGIQAGRMEVRGGDGRPVSARLAGAGNRALAELRGLVPGVSHYASGGDPSRWLWDVPHYSGLLFHSVYPGVDVSYHGTGDDIEFDFLVAAGADPSRIALRFSEPVRMGTRSELRLAGTTLKAPRAWQTLNGARVAVDVAFEARPGNGIGFRLGKYDRSAPLIIDPIVQMATFLGGSNAEAETRLAAGAEGEIYLAGATLSADFPASLPDNSILNRPVQLLAPDVYVARISRDGSTLDWSLFLSGNMHETALGLKRDRLGNLFLLGATRSPNFPTTPGAYRTRIHSALADLFIVKMDQKTGHIKASTFLGAAQRTDVLPGNSALAVDTAGGVYVAGRAYDEKFQGTPGAFQVKPVRSYFSYGESRSFALRMNPALSAVVYVTLFEMGYVADIDVDGAGNLVLGGTSADFKSLGNNAFPAVNPIAGVNQSPDWAAQAFVAKLNAMGSALSFASLLHGNGRSSSISNVRFAPDGTIFAAGKATTGTMPQVNPPATDPPQNSTVPSDFGESQFWAKIPATGGSLLQSATLLGPQFMAYSGIRPPVALVVRSGGAPCLVGVEMVRAYQTVGGLGGDDTTTYQGMACVNEAGTRYETLTMLPPTGGTYTEAELSPDGTLLLAGTASSGLETTPNVYQSRFQGVVWPSVFGDVPNGNAFAMRIGLDNPSPQVQVIVPEAMLVETGVSGTRSLDVYGSGFGYGADVRLNGTPVKSLFRSSAHLAIQDVSFGSLLPGVNNISVSLPAPGGGTAEGMLNGVNPTPAGISVSPASVTQGAGETKLVVRASGLAKDATLYWNGAPRTAKYAVETGRGGHFELILTAEELAQPFVALLKVSNPAPGGGMSEETLFTVQPVSGTGVPALSLVTNPLVFGGPTPLGPKIALFGTNLTADTHFYWDGNEIRAEWVSSRQVNIEPPVEDLNRWGAHDVYAANGTYRSATVRWYVARSAATEKWAADPVHDRFYAIAMSWETNNKADLIVYDMKTGAVLNTVREIAKSVWALTVSTDGSYVYWADYSSPIRIGRYNTATGIVDLSWQTDVIHPGSPTTWAWSLLPVPDRPESVIVSTTLSGAQIYDRDKKRGASSIAAGFQAGDQIMFATHDRIYLASTDGSCWRWMDYDAYGITGGNPVCSAATPADAARDGGLLYLRDGERVYPVAVPVGATSSTPSAACPIADIERRRVYCYVNQYSATKVVEHDLDNFEQRVRALVPTMNASAQGIWPAGHGAFLIPTRYWIALVP